MNKYVCLIILILGFFSVQVKAEEESLIDWYKTNISNIWHSDNYELYVPVHTWHNRLTYDERVHTYNENPWGAGLGKYAYDDQGNQHSLYFMMFKDSHNKWEPIGGYGWMKNWYPLCTCDFSVGLGYTIFVTARDDYRYIPFPAVLPLASIEYKSISLQGTYIPGIKNNGNVAFFWARYKF